MTTTIQKWGNSHGIRIPKFVLDTVKWDSSEELVINVENNKIIIEKAEPRKNIKELFEGYEGTYKPVEMEWGEPVGKEIW